MSGLDYLDTIGKYNFSSTKIKNNPKTVVLKQLKILKQFVSNLCGYHAIFSLIQLSSYMKTGDIYFLERLTDSKVFW